LCTAKKTILAERNGLRQRATSIPHIFATIMKLHLNTDTGINTINGHGDGYVKVNGREIRTALIVMPDKLIEPWPVGDFASLSLADFAALMDIKPALVVFGAGATFRFPDARIMAAFSQARIGFEVMDTAAACRTYNVLAGEGRVVAAALLV
jgi:uncharacterized protein